MPVLSGSERLLVQIGNITARRGKHEDLFSSCVTIHLTSHRAVLSVPGGPEGVGYEVSLSEFVQVRDISKASLGFLQQGRIGVQLCFSAESTDSLCLLFSSALVKDEFLRLAQSALRDRAFLPLPPPAVAATATATVIPSTASDSTPTPAPALTGIARIQQDQSLRLQAAAMVTQDASRDLESLMSHAAEVVKLVDSYALYLNRDAGKGTGAAPSDEVGQMEEMLLSIGMVSPVTRLSAGREYHAELARQLAGLLHEIPPSCGSSGSNGSSGSSSGGGGGSGAGQSRIVRMGGILTLPEVFCLYNRARGTELVSPDDLCAAAEILASLPALGLKLKRFASGVKCIELAGFDDGVFARRLVELCSVCAGDGAADGSSGGGSSGGGGSSRRSSGVPAGANSCASLYVGRGATEIQRLTGLSLLVCKEQLGAAERGGLLCRDEGAWGTRYFPNLFFA